MNNLFIEFSSDWSMLRGGKTKMLYLDLFSIAFDIDKVLQRRISFSIFILGFGIEFGYSYPQKRKYTKRKK